MWIRLNPGLALRYTSHQPWSWWTALYCALEAYTSRFPEANPHKGCTTCQRGGCKQMMGPIKPHQYPPQELVLYQLEAAVLRIPVVLERVALYFTTASSLCPLLLSRLTLSQTDTRSLGTEFTAAPSPISSSKPSLWVFETALGREDIFWSRLKGSTLTHTHAKERTFHWVALHCWENSWSDFRKVIVTCHVTSPVVCVKCKDADGGYTVHADCSLQHESTCIQLLHTHPQAYTYIRVYTQWHTHTHTLIYRDQTAAPSISFQVKKEESLTLPFSSSNLSSVSNYSFEVSFRCSHVC